MPTDERATGSALIAARGWHMRMHARYMPNVTISHFEQFHADAAIARSNDPAATPGSTAADSARVLDQMQHSAPWFSDCEPTAPITRPRTPQSLCRA